MVEHNNPPAGGRVDLITAAARDALDVRKVVGDPVVQGEVTILPIARVVGGSGIGYGAGTLDAPSHRPMTGGAGHGDGGGGGFGVSSRALGVYVVRPDSVEWRPALDLTRVVLGGQVVVLVAVVVLGRLLRHRRRR